MNHTLSINLYNSKNQHFNRLKLWAMNASLTSNDLNENKLDLQKRTMNQTIFGYIKNVIKKMTIYL